MKLKFVTREAVVVAVDLQKNFYLCQGRRKNLISQETQSKNLKNCDLACYTNAIEKKMKKNSETHLTAYDITISGFSLRLVIASRVIID